MEIIKESEDTCLIVNVSIVENLPVEAIIPGSTIVDESDVLITILIHESRKLWVTGVIADFTIVFIKLCDVLTLPVATPPLV